MLSTVASPGLRNKEGAHQPFRIKSLGEQKTTSCNKALSAFHISLLLHSPQSHIGLLHHHHPSPRKLLDGLARIPRPLPIWIGKSHPPPSVIHGYANGSPGIFASFQDINCYFLNETHSPEQASSEKDVVNANWSTLPLAVMSLARPLNLQVNGLDLR